MAPPVRCLQLAYLNHVKALDAKRQVLRQYGIATEPVYCETCEKYHLRSETWPPVRKWRDILILLAQGYRYGEIARTLGLSMATVKYATFQMCKDWHALSVAHLITIVTSFGILTPPEFLLLDEDLARYRPVDTRKATYHE